MFNRKLQRSSLSKSYSSKKDFIIYSSEISIPQQTFYKKWFY